MPLIRCHSGNPNHPPCVFLHGFLGAKEDWDEMKTLLCQSFFCLSFDLPGHGSSPDICPNYLKILKDEIAHSVECAPILIGYSMGGRLALQLAEADPSCYSHVIVLSAHPGIRDEKEREARRIMDLNWIEKLKCLSMDAFLKEWYAQPLFHSLRKKTDVLQSILKKRRLQDPHRMAKVLWTLSTARQTAIHSFHKHTLFLYGDGDEKYQKLYSGLPKELAVRPIEHSGHVVHLENPMICAERILQWLEEQR